MFRQDQRTRDLFVEQVRRRVREMTARRFARSSGDRLVVNDRPVSRPLARSRSALSPR
jgi:hypothetical protein